MRYKNIYITKMFHELDRRRGEMGMENVMPLTHKERRNFIEISSIKLVTHEIRRMLSSTVFLFFSTMHLCLILIGDYSLFWVMTVIRFYGSRYRASSDIESEGKTGFSYLLIYLW